MFGYLFAYLLSWIIRVRPADNRAEGRGASKSYVRLSIVASASSKLEIFLFLLWLGLFSLEHFLLLSLGHF